MSDLIHKIVGIIIEVGQSDTKKFRLGETIRYTPSEILEILKQHENEIFGEESSTQPNTSNTLNALDYVSKQAVIKAVDKHTFDTDEGLCLDEDITCILEEIPSAQPEKRKGKWIKIDDDLISGRCSQCGWEAHLYEDDVFGMDYCPNCGTKMEV